MIPSFFDCRRIILSTYAIVVSSLSC